VTAGLPALLTFRPSPPLASLTHELASLVAVRACNGAGKSYAVTRKVARRALDVPGSFHRIVGPNRAQVREVTGRYLYQWLAPYLHPSSRYFPGTGWNRNGIILTKDGSQIQLCSYQDDPQVQEGRWDLDTILLDEVPPQAHYMANKGRAKHQLLLSFTVQTKAPPLWLKKEIEGDDPSPTTGRTEHSTGWVQYVVPLTRQNVPWLSEDEYNEKVRKYQGTDEESRRLHAAWEGFDSDRKFGGWSSRLIRTREQLRKELCGPTGALQFEWARYGIDHGNSGVGKQCGYLIVGRGGRYYVLHEWLGTNTTTPRDAAQGLLDGLAEWGLKPQHLRAIVGDLNSAGPMGAGQKLNEVIEYHLREIAGTAGPGITAPVKTGGWKEAREAGMNTAMLEGRWFVCDECPAAIRANANYTGHHRDAYKDAVDAQGYAVQDLVVDVPRAPAPEYRRH
jgi:hypothetical protein